MASIVTYNGINLGLVRTIKVKQKSKMDPSNTDSMWIVNTYTIQSVLSSYDPDGVNGREIGEVNRSPADRMAELRHMLLSPRKPFSYKWDDGTYTTTMLEVTGLDAANGPMPIDCDIVKVGDSSFLIELVIEIAIQDCTANQAFASNRMETTHDIDEHGYSTITTLGRIFVRSDMKKDVDSLRWVCAPPLMRGFKRKSKYQIHEDGLSMLYRITDTEMYLAPPVTAMEATGRFTITAQPPGAIMWASAEVNLIGRKNQPKRQLMETAILMALKRLEAGGVQNEPNKDRPWVQGGTLSEDLFSNSVSVHLTARILPNNLVVKPNGVADVGYGFWRGFFLGIVGNAVVPQGGGSAESKAVSGFWGKAANILGVGGAIRAAIVAARMANARTQEPVPPVEGEKAPEAPGATFENIAARFGTPVEGCEQFGIVDPGLRGNINFMTFVAAAFRDPCVAAAADIINAAGGVGAALKRLGVNNFAIDNDSKSYVSKWISGQEDFNNALIQLVNDDRDNPSLDWRNQNLGEIVGVSDFDGSLEMTQVAVLPEELKPRVPADEFLGHYEAWYAEISHELDFNQDVLAATVAGYPAVKVQWSNSLRTVTVKWSATKANFPPELPMILNDDNTVILYHKMDLPTIEMSGDGKTPIFTCSGNTIYKTLDDSYTYAAYPLPPWVKVPMSAMPGPIPSASMTVTGGAAGAAQIARNDPGNGANNNPGAGA